MYVWLNEWWKHEWMYGSMNEWLKLGKNAKIVVLVVDLTHVRWGTLVILYVDEHILMGEEQLSNINWAQSYSY